MATGALGTADSGLGFLTLGYEDAEEIIVIPQPEPLPSVLRQNAATFCWPNRIGQAVLSGGNWNPLWPLTNVAEQVFDEKTRSANTLPASTRFTMALDKTRGLGVGAIAAHNLTQTAKVRWRLFRDLSGTQLAYDSGDRGAWPESYIPDAVEWEDNNFWFGDPVLDPGSDYTPLAFVFFPDVINCQRIDVQITDTNNPDGYVSFGRVFIASAWQPEKNIEYGCEFNHIDNTQVTRAGNGTKFFDLQRRERTVSVQFGDLNISEAYDKLFAMQRDLGRSGELLFSYELAPGPANFFRTFIGTLGQMDPIRYPYFATHQSALFIEEKL